MNERKKYRLLIGLVIGLVLLNAALLFWISPLGPGRSGRWRSQNERRTYLARQLDFTDVQRERYEGLRARYFTQRRTLSDSMRPVRKQFFEQLDDTARTDADLLRQAQTFHNQLAQIDLLTLRHFQQVAKICTPEQRIKLRNIVGNLGTGSNRTGRRFGPEKKESD